MGCSSLQLTQALDTANLVLKQNINNIQWLNNKYKALMAFGWYSIDKQDYKQSIQFYLTSITTLNILLQHSPDSLSLQHFLQESQNQIAFAYLLNNSTQKAEEYANKAVQNGINLHLRAPKNPVYYRALAYSYSTLGDIYTQTSKTTQANSFYQKGLAISKQIVSWSPENPSLKNDLAVDTMNVALLFKEKGDLKSAQGYWLEAEHILESLILTLLDITAQFMQHKKF